MFLYSSMMAAGVVFLTVSVSPMPASHMTSLCPVRNAAVRVAASGVDRTMYSSKYGRPLSK
jgi:hypothetical protein